MVGEAPGVLELRPGGDDHLLLRAHLPHWEELVHVVQRARHIANLDLDVDEPVRVLAADRIVGRLIRERPGVRPPGTWSPFELGVRAIIGQQVSVAAANTVSGRLVERLGTRVPGLEPLGLTHTFPSAATLAGADYSGVGLMPARGEAIRSFARAVVEDRVRLDRSVTLDRLVASLAALDGLGPWTAHYIALRLGEPDAFPTTDLGLRHAYAGLAPHETLGEAAERWRPWRALVATHLWTTTRRRRGRHRSTDRAQSSSSSRRSDRARGSYWSRSSRLTSRTSTGRPGTSGLTSGTWTTCAAIRRRLSPSTSCEFTWTATRPWCRPARRDNRAATAATSTRTNGAGTAGSAFTPASGRSRVTELRSPRGSGRTDRRRAAHPAGVRRGPVRLPRPALARLPRPQSRRLGRAGRARLARGAVGIPAARGRRGRSCRSGG